MKMILNLLVQAQFSSTILSRTKSPHSESYLWKVIMSAGCKGTTKNLGTVNLSLSQDFNLSSPNWKTASQSTATFRKKLQLYNI
jgi:hypothetical protein